MKRTLFYGNGGKIIAGMLALILIVSGVYFPRTDANKVMAADSTDSTTPTGFVAEQMDVTNETPTKEEYLFAGWYTAATCKKEEAITTKVVGQHAYAKFVPTEVLSVKAQTSETVHEADDEFDYQYKNLRLLTTVESLNFNKVGFRVYFDGGEGVDLPIDTVYSRIIAGNGGVAYKYSAKVVDTKSEYFATTTLTGIKAETEFDKVFRIEPYWVTFDGTRVYGVTRYLTVNDADNGIINIPVKVDSTTDVNDLTVTYGTSNTSATVKTRYTNGATDAQYVNLAVMVEGTLPSATKFTVSDGTKVIHRNLTTDYLTNGVADTSWYEITLDENENEFVIATSADLYGFASLSSSNSFSGDTIYLAADIVANNGSVTSTTTDGVTTYSWTGETNYAWPRIATSDSIFKGTFDGCNHNISGLYVSATQGQFGFFRYAGQCEIKNFSIIDSYINSTQKNVHVGSVVGEIQGSTTLDNVHSNAYVFSPASGGTSTNPNYVGGLVGLASGNNANIINCSYSGRIEANGTYVGGVVGYVEESTQLSNVDCSAELIGNSTSNIIGGLVGYAAEVTSIQIDVSKYTGAISGSGIYSGGIMGQTKATTTIIQNTSSSATISSTNSGATNIGGIVARAQGTTLDISGCRFAGELSGQGQYMGGMLANLVTGGVDFTNCLNEGTVTCQYTGTIDGGSTYVAGILGGIANKNLSATVTNCINVGKITEKNQYYTGAIYGGTKKTGTSVMYENSYATEESSTRNVGYNISNTVDVDGITRVTEYAITGVGAYHLLELDFVNEWSIQDVAVPVPRAIAKNSVDVTNSTKADTSWYSANAEATTYYIDDAADLYGLAVLVNNGTDDFAGDTIVLRQNIDLNPNWENTFAVVNNSPVQPEVAQNLWMPIGCASYPFKGTFGGESENTIKTISGLYLNHNKNVYDTGLFGHVSDATMQNFALVDGYIYSRVVQNGTRGTGTIIGTGDAVIKNIYSDIDVYGVHASAVAGFIGLVDDGNNQTNVTVENSWYDGTIVLRTDDTIDIPLHNTGGILGYVKYGTEITLNHTLFTGTINYKTGRTAYDGTLALAIGGLIGRDNGTSTNITITDSLSAGQIKITENAGVTLGMVASVVGRKSSSGTIGINTVYATDEVLAPIVSQTNTEVSSAVEIVSDWSDIRELNESYWTISETTPVLSGLASYAGWECP